MVLMPAGSEAGGERRGGRQRGRRRDRPAGRRRRGERQRRGDGGSAGILRRPGGPPCPRPAAAGSDGAPPPLPTRVTGAARPALDPRLSAAPEGEWGCCWPINSAKWYRPLFSETGAGLLPCPAAWACHPFRAGWLCSICLFSGRDGIGCAISPAARRGLLCTLNVVPCHSRASAAPEHGPPAP